MRGLLLSLLLPSFAAAEGASVYQVRPSLDWPVTLGTGAATLSIDVFGNGLVNKRCPCGDVGAAVLAPVAADWLDVGYGLFFREDMRVFAKTLSVNGALVTAA